MLRERVAQALPPAGLARSLAVQALLFGAGEGTFMTANAVYFTKVIGLSVTQVGLGLSIYAAVSVVLAVPLAKVVARLGNRRSWLWFESLWGASYLAWPWAHGFSAYVAILVWGAVTESVASAGRGAYSIDAFEQHERVRSQAFMRAALNVGFTLGAAVGGLALALPGLGAVRAIPYFAFSVLLVNISMIARLPDTRSPDAPKTTERAVQASDAAWRNRGYTVMSICQGVLQSHQTLLSIVVPLWLVTETHAPRPFLAVLFATNTVGAVLFQVAASRGSHTVAGALRATNLAVGSFVLACVLIMNTGTTLGALTVVLIWCAHVAITGAELFESAGTWGLMSELSDPLRRAEYMGVSNLGSQVGMIVTPTLYTALVMHWGMLGWIVIGGLVVLTRIVMEPAVRAARDTAAHFTDPAPAPELG